MKYLLLVATLIHCLPPKEKKSLSLLHIQLKVEKIMFLFNNLSIELVLTRRKNCKFFQIYNQLNLTQKKFNKLKEK